MAESVPQAAAHIVPQMGDDAGTMRYPSSEWIAAWVAAINESDVFRSAAISFEGAFGSRVRAEPDRSVPNDIYLWFKAHGGRLIEHRYDCEESLVSSARLFTDASYSVWKDLMRGQLDVVRAALLGKVRIHGDRRAAWRLTKAVREMVRLASGIPTEFVDDHLDGPAS